MTVKGLAPILERANIPSQLRLIRRKVDELKATKPRTPEIALEIQRLTRNELKIRQDYIHLVFDSESKSD